MARLTSEAVIVKRDAGISLQDFILPFSHALRRLFQFNQIKPISHHRDHQHDRLMILLTAALEIPSNLAASANVRPSSRMNNLASSLRTLECSHHMLQCPRCIQPHSSRHCEFPSISKYKNVAKADMVTCVPLISPSPSKSPMKRSNPFNNVAYICCRSRHHRRTL